jgi:ketopantoate reductase
MDFVVVGAGAVGAVVGTLLEHAGHTVHYWARAGQARSTAPFEIERDAGARIRSQPLSWIDAETSPLPRSDWVLVCVRTEQLSAALAQVVEHLGAERATAIATVTLDGSLAVAREAGLTGPVLAFHVSFGSGFIAQNAEHARRLKWFPFTPPSTISAEGQPQLREPARKLAFELARAGLPTSSVLDMGGMMQLMVMANMALLPSWELCRWDIAKLAANSELRWLTARAMHEAVRQFAPVRGPSRLLARLLPVAAYAFVLRILPWLMGARARKLWLVHGPKITEQTRHFLGEVLARAEREHRPLPHLVKLTARWEAEAPPLQPMAAAELRA